MMNLKNIMNTIFPKTQKHQ